MVQLHDFPFYAGVIALKAADAKAFPFDATRLIGGDGWNGEGLRLVSRQRGKAEEARKPARLGQGVPSPLPELLGTRMIESAWPNWRSKAF